MSREKRHKGVVYASFKTVVLFALLFGAIGAIWYYASLKATYGLTAKNIGYIREHINGRGEIVDWQNNIGVKGIDDIKLFRDEKAAITIQYGKIELNWKRLEDFLDKDNLDRLKQIMITVKKSKSTGEIKIYWRDEEVEPWVR